MFGEGRLPAAGDAYRETLRPHLSPWSQSYWDRHIDFFDHPQKPFYFRGTSGQFAQGMNWYINKVVRRPRTD